MAIKLPQARFSDAPRRPTPKDNTDLILRVMGNNPYAQAIDQITPVLSKALEQRALRRRQANTVQQMASTAGEAPPDQNNGLDPETYGKLLAIKTGRANEARQEKLNAAEEARKNNLAVLQALQAQSGYTGTDANGKPVTYPGIRGIQPSINDQGLFQLGTEGFQPGMKPIVGAGKGAGGGGYSIPRGVDPATNRVVYSDSKRMGLFYDDGKPYTGGAPGALNLKTLPSDQIQKETDLASLKFSLDKVKGAYNDDLVGPLGARVGRGKQYLEGTSTPEAADFYSNVADLKNQMLYLRSGKQINESEYNRLLQALPNEYMSPTDFKKRLSNFEQLYNNIVTTRQNALQGSGYRMPQQPTLQTLNAPTPTKVTHRWNPQTKKVEVIP